MRKEDKQELVSAFGMVGSIGLTMFAALIVSLFLGRTIDKWLGSAPWATLLGISAGLLTGLWAAYKKVMGR